MNSVARFTRMYYRKNVVPNITLYWVVTEREVVIASVDSHSDCDCDVCHAT